MSNRRIRGVAIHRPILVGSTSTPLTSVEKLSAPPDHTHKWTVAVRSAASHLLPSLAAISGGLSASTGLKQGDEVSTMAAAAASPSTEQGVSSSSAGAAIGTRGREQQVDYHSLVGGKDDISYFIRRVQFKLHDTYTQPTRNFDKPPFSVTETGWGEFDIQVKIFFIPEASEKPVTLFHHLKLHPWLNMLAPPPEPSSAPAADAPAQASTQSEAVKAADTVITAATAAADTSASATDVTMLERAEPDGAAAGETTSSVDATQQATTAAAAPTASTSSASAAILVALPPVVHSWQYDEIVFPEPTEAFYEVLIAHPPSALPVTSAQAFSDPSAYRSYQSALDESASSKGVRSSKLPLLPPHPLHAPTGYLLDALSQEAQQAESDRLDLARISAVKELEKGRERLIRAERALKEVRTRISTASTTSAATAAEAGSSAAPAFS